MKRIPKTRYPLNLERGYAKNVRKLLQNMDDVIFYEFDKHLATPIDSELLISDSIRNDALSDIAKKILAKIKVLTNGAFTEKDAKKIVRKHVNSVSSTNKSNIDSQLGVRGINPIQSETWLKGYADSKIAENVSYITNIRDEYTKKIEQSIYRGVTGGKSSAEIRDELVKVSGMSKEKADFIARDQTGSILGQLTAKRHEKAGIEAFRWSDSGDSKVRASHHERDDKIYFYKDNPLLPGEEYNCRCVAEPVFDDELEELYAKQSESKSKMAEKIEKPKNVTYNYVTEAEYKEMVSSVGKIKLTEKRMIEDGRDGYIATANAFNINEALRKDLINRISTKSQKTIKVLDNIINNNVIPKNVVTERWLDDDWLLDKLSFLSQNTPIKLQGDRISAKKVADIFNQSSGLKFVEKGYSSVSAIPEDNAFQRRNIKLVINVPKGSKGYVTQNVNESEIILPRNAEFEIVKSKVKTRENGNEFLEVVLNMKGVK